MKYLLDNKKIQLQKYDSPQKFVFLSWIMYTYMISMMIVLGCNWFFNLKWIAKRCECAGPRGWPIAITSRFVCICVSLSKRNWNEIENEIENESENEIINKIENEIYIDNEIENETEMTLKTILKMKFKMKLKIKSKTKLKWYCKQNWKSKWNWYENEIENEMTLKTKL